MSTKSTKKEQAFATHYSWSEPSEERANQEIVMKETFYLVFPDGREWLASRTAGETRARDRLVEWIREHGGKIDVEREPDSSSARYDDRRPDAYLTQRRALDVEGRERVRAIEQKVEDVLARAGAGGRFYVGDGYATIETPTRLGKGEHFARRVLVEAFLKEHTLAFDLDCSTKHSDVVCQPLNLVMPDIDAEAR